MQIRFLGGAREVGASCVLVTTAAGRNILLDCGVRVNEEGTGMLPNLEPLNDVTIDSIIISHAHLDHCGALPVVAKLSPGTWVHATNATRDIAKVMLYDAIKVAEFREGLSLYDDSDAERALDATMTHGYGASFEAAPGVQAMFLPAGHILGAAAVLLQMDEGTLLYTGDFTTFEQETVGMQKFSHGLRRGVDVVITEATYGSRLHAPRVQEVQRLLDAIGAAAENGGRTLIPAFALGRAQEIILALRNYIRRTKKKIPVYVDGLIRNVNLVFERNPNYLAERYKREVLRGDDLFYTNGIEAIDSKAKRDKILASNGPWVAIASSGMLTGGVSPIYAERIVQDSGNLLAIVGYQDEESPGRKLLDLAAKPEVDRKVVLNGSERQVKCKVEGFGLSAHADSFGIVASVKALQPRLVLVNHGSDESLSALAESLADQMPEARVEIAAVGQAHEYAPSQSTGAGRSDGPQLGVPSASRRYSLNPHVQEIALDREDHLDPTELWRHLLANGVGGTAVTVGDLLTVWHGRRELGDDEKQQFRQAVRDDRRFMPAAGNPNLVHVLTEAEYTDAVTPHPMEQNAARSLVQERLGRCGLQRLGFGSDGTITLYFPTPEYAKRCADIIERIRDETVRKVDVAQTVNAEFIKAKLRSELAAGFGFSLERDPSFQGDVVTVRLPESCDGDPRSGLTLEDYIAAFEDETGLKLIFRSDGTLQDAQSALGAAGAASAAADDVTVTVAASAAVAAPITGNFPRLEQNVAKGAVEEAFASRPHRPKVGIYREEGVLALSFVSPQVGHRYDGLLQELERTTGWRLQVQASVRVNELAEAARSLLRARGMGDMKVGVFEGYAEARSSVHIDDDTASALNEEYRRQTGFELRFRRV
ncbi:MAG: MBL fold metallo-hydrolase [Clostridia bacterium]|nr:MBL fold metallo-hydrolase [Clostridia bacterium]